MLEPRRVAARAAAGFMAKQLGEAVGEIYVKDHYPAESERQMTELIGNLRAAYQERISHNSWMDDATRKEALAKLAAKVIIHAVSLDRERRTSGPVIEAAVRSAMARAREIGATSIAFPALGTGVGGFPLDEAARITVQTVREELAESPTIDHVIFALRGTVAYQAFSAALHPVRETIGGGAG